MPHHHHHTGSHIVYITGFCDAVNALDTKTKPKRIRVLGSDGISHSFLLKGNEDLRLDERVMQFLRISNDLYDRHQETSSRSLRARHYNVTPLSHKSGLIEWVSGVVSMFKIAESHFNRHQDKDVREENKRENKTWNAVNEFHDVLVSKTNQKCVSSSPKKRSEYPEQTIRDVFTELQRRTPRDLLSSEIWMSSTDTSEWCMKRRTYCRSLAVMSMFGYIIGLGDRHLENVLMDFHSGEILHIDYNVCFDKGLRLRVPECLPFRLTKSMRHALGVMQTSGNFERACVMTMCVLRKHRELFLELMETFVYDPLIEWTKTSTKRHNDGSSKNNATTAATLDTAAAAAGMKDDSKRESNDYAIGVVRRIDHRLNGGTMENLESKFDIETQVNSLIRHAISKKYLSRMYEGWAAWV